MVVPVLVALEPKFALVENGEPALPRTPNLRSVMEKTTTVMVALTKLSAVLAKLLVVQVKRLAPQVVGSIVMLPSLLLRNATAKTTTVTEESTKTGLPKASLATSVLEPVSELANGLATAQEQVSSVPPNPELPAPKSVTEKTTTATVKSTKTTPTLENPAWVELVLVSKQAR